MVRKREETKRKMEEKERKQREKEKAKRLKQQKINQQRREQKQEVPILSKISHGHRSDPSQLSKEQIGNFLRRAQSQEVISPSTADINHFHKMSPYKSKMKLNDYKNTHSSKGHKNMNNHQMAHSRNPQNNQMTKSKARPLINNDSAPSIDLFRGGSLFSDYTKKFMKIGKKTNDDDESSEYEDTSNDEDDGSESVEFEEQTVWNHKSHQNGHHKQKLIENH